VADNLTDAYRWLDKHMAEALQAPDEHHDWVYMLKPPDWAELERNFISRPPAWREAFAYVVAQGPPEEAMRVLRVALEDRRPEVASQAALSVVDLADLFPDQVSLDDAMAGQLRRVAKSEDGNLGDLREFLNARDG